jgi:hypothetical protein
VIEVQLAISYLHDGHLLAVPVDPRVIVVLQDGQPGDGSHDGDPQEDGPEGSIQALHLFPLLTAGPAFLSTVDILQRLGTVKVLLEPLHIWNVETIPESANRVQIEWFPGVVSKHLAKPMYVNIQGSRISHVGGFPNLPH